MLQPQPRIPYLPHDAPQPLEAEPDGSTHQVSGRGYFQSDFSGLLFAIKDSERFVEEPGYWAYFSFGFVPASEYAESAPVLPAEAGNSCHATNAAEDWVFTQFYPGPRAGKAQFIGVRTSAIQLARRQGDESFST